MPSRFVVRAGLTALGIAFAGCEAPSIDAEDSADFAPTDSPLLTTPTIEGATVVEGDMIFSNDKIQGVVASRTSSVKRWPNGVVPYDIEPGLPRPERVTEAAKQWLDKAGIRWVPRTNEADYVHFKNGKGCASYTGRQGGKQDIYIEWTETGARGHGCTTNNVAHEMGHTLGLAHEQSRSDRDDYITILSENIDDRYKVYFSKTNFQSIGEYDLHSVMHYSSYAFSKNKKPTILAKDGTRIPDHGAVSDKDGAGVREYYARELRGDNSDLGGKNTVSLTWPRKSNTAKYSLDVQGAWGDDLWTAPCIDAGILQRNLSTMFTFSCPSSGDRPRVNIDLMRAFRLCWAENDDWAHAGCEIVPYRGETSLFLGPM
ncbi:MAG TPA: M12 family metallopeptidase [Labilithrix sp.]|jgi:hypothetical protein|nr:M12 family metallopeptidase [Labilithrix sp.]